ncbi:MAG: DNA/RNA non-specific endonuclease [Burkholderiaceae bacterium]|jgi:endonuclease G|nr:DNA/RNA non-specific endonuclease [Burkholderiaceae bacterium]
MRFSFLGAVSLLSVSWALLPAAHAESFADCPQFFPAKPPAVTQFQRLRELCFNEFAVLHSGETKTPVYVVQRLNARKLEQGANIKRKDRFYPEARLPSADRAQLDDYKRSGFSRGHMAAAGDMSTEEGKAQTFSLANMVPQDPKHNGGAWGRIEQDTRRYIRRAGGDVFVITGPVFGDARQTIGAGRVRVPQALFKLVYDPGTGKSWVHWQQNAADTRVTEPISYAEFVRRTGLEFLRD